jgi:hypothetical protein
MEGTTWEIGFGTARSGDDLIDPESQGLNSGRHVLAAKVHRSYAVIRPLTRCTVDLHMS